MRSSIRSLLIKNVRRIAISAVGNMVCDRGFDPFVVSFTA